MRCFLFSFEGYYPVGAFMLVIAENKTEATKLFEDRLPAELKIKNRHLKPTDGRLEIKLTKSHAYMISDGNY